MLGHSMLLNAGTRDGVRKGQAVMAGEALVGYIAEVGERRLASAAADRHQRPYAGDGGIHRTSAAILIGRQCKPRPKLMLMPGAANVQPGDRIVTSARRAPPFPPGLPVGTVASVDGTVWVEPLVHRDEMEYVTVVDYGLGGILPFSDRPPPPPGRRRPGGEN